MNGEQFGMWLIRIAMQITFIYILYNWDGASATAKWLIWLALEIYGSPSYWHYKNPWRD